MSPDQRLTLGALYHEMRAGIGDTGRVRVAVEFQQRNLALGDGGTAVEPASLVLETLVEYEERALDRAQVALYGSGPPKRFMVARLGDGYAYSLDRGERWGPLAGHPRIFDLGEFEAQLGQIAVQDATIDVVDGSEADRPASAEGPLGEPAVIAERCVDALDVSLDRDAFLRLLHVFSADVDDDAEAPLLHAYSVSLEAADDVALHYWWSLHDEVSAPALPLKVRCAVSIRVTALGEAEPASVRIDPALPVLADLDGVWAAVHRGASEAGDESEIPPGG
ncbi:MAG: hypothetical protein ACLQT7_08010 [Candidatus Dormibacteria bacterium]